MIVCDGCKTHLGSSHPTSAAGVYEENPEGPWKPSGTEVLGHFCRGCHKELSDAVAKAAREFKANKSKEKS